MRRVLLREWPLACVGRLHVSDVETERLFLSAAVLSSPSHARIPAVTPFVPTASELTRPKGGGLRFGVLVRLMQATEDMRLRVSAGRGTRDRHCSAACQPLTCVLASPSPFISLQSAVLTLVNSLINTAEELDLRVHLRNEIYNCAS